MIFGIKFNFNSIMSGITAQLKSIVPTNIPNIGDLAKGGLINSALGKVKGQISSMINNAVGFNIASKIGNLGSSLKGLSTASMFGLVSTKLVNQLKNLTSQYTDVFKNINLTDLNISKLVTSQISNIENLITEELQSGLLIGKSSLKSLISIEQISNKTLRDITFDPVKKAEYVKSLTDLQMEDLKKLATGAISEDNTFKADTKRLQQIQQPPMLISASESYAPSELKRYKETLTGVDTNSNIIKKSNINISKRNQKEVLTVNSIIDERDVDKPSPMLTKEINEFPDKGYPERFLLYPNRNDFRYADVFGSTDPNNVKLILLRGKSTVSDKRFPEISGTLQQYVRDLSNAGILKTGEEISNS
tara:strand:+ start:300 stop:1385 length:1086 start_codon:yes stop_codon:yes gene_type:complete